MRAIIKSAANPKVKLASSLQQGKYRLQEGLFLAEGLRLCEMAAASGWEIAYGCYTMEAMQNPRVEELLTGLEDRCELYEVPLPVFRHMSEMQMPQGILLVMRMRQEMVGMETLFRRKRPLVLALDGVQDPGNVGTVIRTADAAGADGVVLLEGSADAFAPKTVRASMGSIFYVPVLGNVSRAALLLALEEWGIPLFAADLDWEARSCYQCDFREAAAIVFGNEGNGVSKEILGRAEKLHIPMRGHAESLNAAVSAAVVVYEAMRQRMGP